MIISVLIISDIRLYREGLERALGEDGRITVAGTAASFHEALPSLDTIRPDVVLLDIGKLDMTTQDTLLMIRQLVERAPATPIVALSVSEATTEVMACVEAGVAGYVTRESSLEELIQAIEAAIRGELRCSPQIAGCLRQRLTALVAEHGSDSLMACLTSRELRTLELIEKGFSNKDIAHTLKIELSTVKNHVHNILQKLHVSRRREAAALKHHANVQHHDATAGPVQDKVPVSET